MPCDKAPRHNLPKRPAVHPSHKGEVYELHAGARRRAGPRRPAVGWILPLAMLVLVFVPASLAPIVEHAQGQDVAIHEAWPTDVHADPAPTRPGAGPAPVPNQKRAPCATGLELEYSGVCWLPIEKRPCPPQTVAHDGKCLLPVAQARPVPNSVEPSGAAPQ